MKRCLKITVSGYVQGVGYREFVQQHARSLSVEGIAQNTSSGDVLILACGDADSLDDLIDLLYKGPDRAKVELIVAESLMQEKDFRGVFRAIGAG